jgi:phosphoribosylaminoimidazole-succinocarboxamide synthase
MNSATLQALGLPLRHSGKVRDTYDLPDHPTLMMPVASKRVSIFDFILPAHVEQKGEVLTALTSFWTRKVLDPIIETDLVAFGADIDAYLPESVRGNSDLQKTASVVRILPAPDVEAIYRGVITGSGLKSYNANGMICGHALPRGLRDGDPLPYPLFTPTTKATVGHDEHITADSVIAKYGAALERQTIQAALLISNYARSRGILMADTKFEFSLTPEGKLILVDEKGTPDSSRFAIYAAWQALREKGGMAPSMDKEFVRQWGKKVGIDKLDPANTDHVAEVRAMTVPQDVLDMTTKIYRFIFWKLTGMQLETYQREAMGVRDATPPQRRIEVLVGSESDIEQMRGGLLNLEEAKANFGVSVMSCHRNPVELALHLEGILENTDVVIAGAGLAAALPGIVKSHLCRLKRPDIPVIGVAFKGKNETENQAALLSISELPGKPVEFADTSDKPFFGAVGFAEACNAARTYEFLPKNMAAKPTKVHMTREALGLIGSN